MVATTMITLHPAMYHLTCQISKPMELSDGSFEYFPGLRANLSPIRPSFVSSVCGTFPYYGLLAEGL